MNKIKEMPILFNSLESIEKVNQVTNQTNDIIKKYDYYKNDGRLYERENELLESITTVLRYWTENCSVGTSKDKRIYEAYDRLFKNIKQWLFKLQASNNEQEKIFAAKALYQGIVYRRINNKEDYSKKPILEYNDHYVSWSINKESPYLDTHIKGRVLLITAEIKNENYGINLDAFNASVAEEHEIVFPTIKEFITKLEEI